MTKLKVSIHYFHFQDDDSLKIEFRAWLGLIKYKLNIPLIKVDDNSPTIVMKEEVQSGTTEETKKKNTIQYSAEDLLNSLRDIKAILEHVVSFHRILRHFLKKVNVTQVGMAFNHGSWRCCYNGDVNGCFMGDKRKYHRDAQSLF